MKVAHPYPGDNEFRRRARAHQSEFREKALQVDFDSSNPRAKFGNLLPQEAAIQGLIFYEGYRDHIMKLAEDRYGKINGTIRYSNLLRSEHIPLNIFAPMQLNLLTTA
jgi:adenosine/AMP kinase